MLWKKAKIFEGTRILYCIILFYSILELLLLGAITTEKSLDRETISSYTLNITAFDSATPPLQASNYFLLRITVTDSNDNRPEFDQLIYTANVCVYRYFLSAD